MMAMGKMSYEGMGTMYDPKSGRWALDKPDIPKMSKYDMDSASLSRACIFRNSFETFSEYGDQSSWHLRPLPERVASHPRSSGLSREPRKLET